MTKVYDAFIDDYIDESLIDPCAPPERYREITATMIINNAARWFTEGLNKKKQDKEFSDSAKAFVYTCKKCGCEFFPALFNNNDCPKCGEHAEGRPYAER